MDFATLVTEDSDIFTACPGKTDVRGKGSQFEAAFNFIRHYATPAKTRLTLFALILI